MKTNEIKVGAVFMVKVSGKVRPVQVIGDTFNGGKHRWSCINLVTGRAITVTSPRRFRERVDVEGFTMRARSKTGLRTFTMMGPAVTQGLSSDMGVPARIEPDGVTGMLWGRHMRRVG